MYENIIKIGFDIDGVVANSFKPIVEEIENLTGIRIEKKIGSKWIIDIENLSNSKKLEIINNCLSKNEKIKVLPSPKIIIPKIYKSFNCQIFFITARSKCLYDVTERWLKENFSDIEFKLIVVGDQDKIDAIKENNISIYVEDRLKNANEIADIIDRMYLINRPYNMNRYTNPKIIRVKNFFEIWDIEFEKKLIPS